MLKELNVSGRRIRVRYVARRELLELKESSGIDEGEQVFGWWSEADRTIYILSSLDDELQLETLCHEICHTILGFSGLSEILEPELEEAVCRAMEAMVSLFRDKNFVKEFE